MGNLKIGLGFRCSRPIALHALTITEKKFLIAVSGGGILPVNTTEDKKVEKRLAIMSNVCYTYNASE